MKKIFLIILIFSAKTSLAQELNLPVYTQYLADNPFVISPAFAGIGDNLRVRANGLSQWVGVEDAPQNASIYGDFRIASQSGVGASFYADKNGYTSQSGAKFTFAHHIILDYYSKQYLSFGLSYNINNFRIDYTKLNPVNPDSYITDDRRTQNNNFDLSLLYRKAAFYVSLNANNVLDKNIDKFYAIEPQLLVNYQLYSGYIFSFNGNKTQFEPSIFYQYFQSDGRSSTDINLKYRILDRNYDYYWVGASYRFLNDQALKPLNLGPMVGLKKSGFYVAYSYQATFNRFIPYNYGTHVLTLGFDFLERISNCPCTQNPVHD
jgi:type IX secretion system PorP/SprF family membrane protein